MFIIPQFTGKINLFRYHPWNALACCSYSVEDSVNKSCYFRSFSIHFHKSNSEIIYYDLFTHVKNQSASYKYQQCFHGAKNSSAKFSIRQGYSFSSDINIFMKAVSDLIFVLQCFRNCLGQLVRAGGCLGTASYAFASRNNIRRLHSLYESADTFCVSVTAADKSDRPHRIIVKVNDNFPRTCPSRSIMVFQNQYPPL